MRSAVRWWCMKTAQPLPVDDAELWYVRLREVMLQLTSSVFNNVGLNVVDLATVVGAVPLLDELLNTPDVYLIDADGWHHDITYLTPQTCDSIAATTSTSSSAIAHPRTSKSCLDLIVDMEDEILAARMLDISPFSELVQNYWFAYTQLYGMLLMHVHIVYMIVYTIYVLPDSATINSVYNTASNAKCRSLPNSDLFGLFLIWPCLVLAFVLCYTISTVW